MGMDVPDSLGSKIHTGNNVSISLEPDTQRGSRAIFLVSFSGRKGSDAA